MTKLNAELFDFFCDITFDLDLLSRRGGYAIIARVLRMELARKVTERNALRAQGFDTADLDREIATLTSDAGSAGYLHKTLADEIRRANLLLGQLRKKRSVKAVEVKFVSVEPAEEAA